MEKIIQIAVDSKDRIIALTNGGRLFDCDINGDWDEIAGPEELQQSAEKPDEQDQYKLDGEWLTHHRVLSEFGFNNSKLTDWARNGCSLIGRQLRRRKFPPHQATFVYQVDDLLEIQKAMK
jgi:hypothetical protein